MGVKVHVRDGEALSSALKRLRKLLHAERPWSRNYKRKKGYYEKPSYLKRQKQYIARRYHRIESKLGQHEARGWRQRISSVVDL